MNIKKVGLAGFGTIGRPVGKALDDGIEGLKLVAICVRDRGRAEVRMADFRNAVPILGPEELAEAADIIESQLEQRLGTLSSVSKLRGAFTAPASTPAPPASATPANPSGHAQSAQTLTNNGASQRTVGDVPGQHRSERERMARALAVLEANGE